VKHPLGVLYFAARANRAKTTSSRHAKMQRQKHIFDKTLKIN
jgi:hypothetical protein